MAYFDVKHKENIFIALIGIRSRIPMTALPIQYFDYWLALCVDYCVTECVC